MASTSRPIVLALLQLTASCVCQKFGAVYRRPVATDKHMIATVQQQYLGAEDSAYQLLQQQQQRTPGVVEQFYQPSAAGGQPYYVQQQKRLLEQQQQSRLRQQQLQLQQLQQFQLQQQLPSSYYQPQQQLPASYFQSQPQDQQYDDLYQQQLLQLQQQQQQQSYQQKPLFRPAIPVNETPAEGQPQQVASEPQQTSPSASNLLGVLYSSAADVSKFQFSGNGVSYSF